MSDPDGHRLRYLIDRVIVLEARLEETRRRETRNVEILDAVAELLTDDQKASLRDGGFWSDP